MSKPHILLITADELRKDALSCYGGEAVQTPNLDRLASQGTLFENAYTPSPLCLPARCSILTGLYPHKSKAYSNFRECALEPELPNLYNHLRAGGYTTSHIGKCHYTPAPYSKTRAGQTLDLEPVKDFYLSLGLDHLDLQNGKHNSIWFWNDYSRELDAAGYLAAYRDACWNKEHAKVFQFPGPAEWHPDAWVGRKGVERIQALDPAAPCFTWVSFSGPHYPMDPPGEYLARVNLDRVGIGSRHEVEWNDPDKIQYTAYHGGPGGRVAEGKHFARESGCKNHTDEYWIKARQYYFANVALIDDWVGRILSAARERFGDNLLVIFTADHGEMLGNHGLLGKNFCGYEDVLNIPFVVRGPGYTAGARCEARVSSLDIAPTCFKLAGTDLPGLDGRDLRDNIADGGYEYIFSETEAFATVQDKRFKYIHCYQNQLLRCELYDLQEDPGEFINLANDPGNMRELARMRAALVEHFMSSVLA